LLKVIGIVSGKGGVGKTVTIINLGLALHEIGYEVILTDTDVTASNLGLQLGFYSFPVTLQNVLKKEADIFKAIYLHQSGLKIIPSSISMTQLNVNLSKLKNSLKELDGLMLVDSPPGLNKDALDVINSSDELIIVTNPEIPAVANATKVIEVVKSKDKNILGIVVNRYKGKSYELKPCEIEEICGVPIIAVIPEDSNVKKSLFKKMPLLTYNPYSPAAIEFRKLAGQLAGKEYQPPRFAFIKRYFRFGK